MKLELTPCSNAYKVIDRVASHAGLLSSQFIRVTRKQGHLYMNLTGLAVASVHLPIPITKGEPDPWVFYLDRRILSAFLSTTQAKAIELLMDKDSLTLRAGRQRALISGTSPISGYSQWKPDGTPRVLKLSAHLKREFELMAKYAPITAAADHLSAVYLVKGYGLLATDSFCLVACLDPTIPETFPLPVILTQLACSADVDTLQMDKQGAGLRFPQGYVYQTLSARSQTDYPLKPVQKIIQDGIATKSLVQIPAQRLLEGLQYLKNFIFGSDVDVFVDLTGKAADKTPRLSFTSSQGEVHKTLSEGAIQTTELKLRWPIAKVLPWIEYVATIKDCQIRCNLTDGNNVLVASDGKRKYVLVVTETV